jgi:kynurenine 3-monooxygenase
MEKIAVVGAGLVGSLQALYLAKAGHEVHVFERRPDMRKTDISAGKSINLALSDRGFKALAGVGMEDEIRSISIPMKGRMMHDLSGNLTFQPYGLDNQAIYSVSRGDLNARLMTAAEKLNNVSYYFDERCLDLDLENNELHFENHITKRESKYRFDRIFGTDGAFSAVRSRLMKNDRFNYSQTYLEHGYKELSFPPNADGSHRVDKNCLHIWPRGQFMMIALPNLDGSFTVTLFFPFEGKNSFEELTSADEVINFFNKTFPDSLQHMPDLKEEYFSNPTSSLVTVKCSPWHYEDKVLIMGDSAHAIVPFYGQGMNSGFEDCTVFSELSAVYGNDWKKLFTEFSKLRKPDTDAIADLALRNHIEMRDLTGDPNFLLQKKIEKKIHQKYPDKWMPLYSQVTFSHIPYSQALTNGLIQDKIMEKIMNKPNIHEIWDSEEVEKEILELIKH